MPHNPHRPTVEPRPRAEDGVADLLRRAGLTMAFQPIVALHDGGVVAYEALARLHPRVAARFPDGPASLFEHAAREHATTDLDHFTHSLALASAPYLAADRLVFINAAPASASHPDFARRAARVARHAQVDPARVVIEITELGDAGDDERLHRNLAELRGLGFGVALDDIGSGHNDLRRILRVRPQWLKLDRSLVQRLDTDPYSRSLVAALVRFAGHNGVHVVAEGVELPSQARVASELGIAHAQGYWFAHPVRLVDAASDRCAARVYRRWRTAALAA